MSEENKTIARRVCEEVFSAQGDLEVADELFAPNFVGHDPASPEDIRGPEGVKEFASMFRNAFPDVQLSVEDQVAEGAMAGTSVERIVEGKIEETWDNYDALGMMEQIGAIPSPEEAQA